MTTMPTDRDALNQALQEALRTQGLVVPCPHGAVGREYCWQCGETDPDYSGNMNATIDALNALGLWWSYSPDGALPDVSVWPIGQKALAEHADPDDYTPAALATAIVQAVVQVLKSDRTP